MVCPYGWDTPGGVQIHIKELAEYFIGRGHEVSVIAPVSDESSVTESYLVPAGRPLAVPFNGSVARVAFGPLATSRVRHWISSNNFDLLHLHRQFYLLQLIHHNFSTLKIFSRGSHLLSLLNTIHLI